jgi:FkbM family methyltransferase
MMPPKSVSLKRRLTRALQGLSSRLGYRLLPEWRFRRWDEGEHLGRLLRLLDIDCVLDVGANSGQYHEFLRLHAGYTGAVVSFEPVAEMYEGLARAMRRDSSWTVHHHALGESDTTAEINVFAERTLSSLLPANEESLRKMGYEKYVRETRLDRVETITVRRLDSIHRDVIPEHARVFLKSDTQGYDMPVVMGASGCLDRVLGIQIELAVREVYLGAPPYLEALSELTGLGYAITGFVPVQRDSTLRMVTVDCIMIKEQEAERLRRAGRHASKQALRP